MTHKLLSSPSIPTIVKNKRHRPNEKPLDEEDINVIVNILGNQLLNVKKLIMVEKDTYTPSAAVTFLLRRMDVDTQNAQSLEIYCLMTAFMTVYLCFIRLLIHQQEFDHFMQLFNDHDSLLNQDNQPFLWFYAVHHMSVEDDLHKQLMTTGRNAHSHPHLILANIDSIFSKFYTHYFLEMSAAKHQKDHGQFYTPQSVLRFMWDKCADVAHLITRLQQKSMCSVFDPCLGIGSFLCEFLTRLIKACQLSLWNDPQRLAHLLLYDIPNHIYGIEIDPFAYQLCKMNMMVHLYPLYRRINELKVQLPPKSIHRLKLFCNDTLKLAVKSNPFWNTESTDPFEKHWLDQLRDASKLKFDFIVTNPPYMIRKTGFITQPDSAIYDESKLGGAKISQAYLYFMWITLQRCDDSNGQVCLITPSQWMVLEFAEQLRNWIWDNCKLLDIYEFEPYKVWPKVQTDSLIFRICKRSSTLPNSNHTLYLRHVGKNTNLRQLLEIYQEFRPDQPIADHSLKYKLTALTQENRVLQTNHSSFSFLLPSVSFLDQLNSITQHLARICDSDPSRSNTAPLVWNRGPNTNPVYSLVVRTSWAVETFGQETCDRWLKPCFYWNGKTISAATGGGKEGTFWKDRDPFRLSKKETSAAEAYLPYYNADVPFYSMIMVNKEDAEKLKEDYANNGVWAALYSYLQDARIALQADKKEEDIANCQYNKCGLVPVKIVHPINCGYFTRSQPRPRFFVDRHKMAVTNQCIYFTVKPDYPWQDPDFFCGLLNSTLLMFFIKLHCSYDQQGRMRFFGRLMAYIPFAPPLSFEYMQWVSGFVQAATIVRSYLYKTIRYSKGSQKLIERVRNFEWHITQAELGILGRFEPPLDWKDSLPNVTQHGWIIELFKKVNTHENIQDAFNIMLRLNSLFQFAIDQMIYHMYRIPENLQLEIEHDLKLDNLRQEWLTFNTPTLDDSTQPEEWHESILSIAQSFVNKP
ncbi:S-adenosyl-L-methionine-dependent methyltransferase [Parasitella parasitica]|nr:S-adenosyl-L-methionine-dependent methyltransferase [Parasitella parasitica]